jgi:hypothetical protein
MIWALLALVGLPCCRSAHAVADLRDGPDGLMAQDPAVADRGQVALEDVQVGAADGGRVDPHDDIAVVGDLRVRYFFPGLQTGTLVDEGSHDCLHWLVMFQLRASSSAPHKGGAESPLPCGLKVTVISARRKVSSRPSGATVMSI